MLNSTDKWQLEQEITLKTETICMVTLIKILAKHSTNYLELPVERDSSDPQEVCEKTVRQFN